MQRHRTLRVGLSAILCALVFRIFSGGIPEKILEGLKKTHIQTEETGRDVRFSPSSEVFSPNFMESPAPVLPEPEEKPLPSFSDPEIIDLYYATAKKPDVAALLAQPLEWNLREADPAVLILHTHATESYTKTGEDYAETSPWRTDVQSYNMLAIGERVQEVLQEQGIAVIQDRSLHDFPSYNGSYTRGRKGIQAYLEEYPGIRLVLDLHRDASEGSRGQMRTQAQVDGKTCAQLMVVLGTNHENYEENLSLGLKLHAMLEQQAPGIMRPLQLRGSRFNQDLSPGALLIEVGAAGNTLEEALLAAQELAKAVAALAAGTE